jgi:hypothetical protein
MNIIIHCSQCPKRNSWSLAKSGLLISFLRRNPIFFTLSLTTFTYLLVWKAQARFTDKTLAIVSNNMESLLHIIGKIDVISHPAFSLPQISITYDTGSLENSFYWIQAWIHGYNEFMSDQLSASKREELKERVDRRDCIP